MALVPSLGCCLYSASPSELEPDGAFAVPPATRIFPKRGIIQAPPRPSSPAPRTPSASGELTTRRAPRRRRFLCALSSLLPHVA